MGDADVVASNQRLARAAVLPGIAEAVAGGGANILNKPVPLLQGQFGVTGAIPERRIQNRNRLPLAQVGVDADGAIGQRYDPELAALAGWKEEYIPLIRPHILKQEIRILEPVFDMKYPDGDQNFHELRTYRLKPGKAAEWTSRMEEAMPAREQYSRNLGLWINIFPDPNEVTHLWAYKSWQERIEARAKSQADPKWQEFLQYAGPLIEEMQSMILMPSTYSPRR